MRRRRLRKYIKTLAELTTRKRPIKRDDLHQALGAAKKAAGRDARHVKIQVTLHGEGKTQTATLTYQLDRHTLRVARRREGRYLLRAHIPDTVLEKFAAVQMLDVHLPTTDGREIVLTRHTQPDKDLQILLHQLQLTLPEQAPPKIQAPLPPSNYENPVVPTF